MTGKFENRLAVTLACDKTIVSSEYGGLFGISTDISQKDHEVLAKFLCAQGAPTNK
jgi:hypothetical protein